MAGFDDDPVAEALGLSTVRHPFEESGRLALRTLRRVQPIPASMRCQVRADSEAAAGPARSQAESLRQE